MKLYLPVLFILLLAACQSETEKDKSSVVAEEETPAVQQVDGKVGGTELSYYINQMNKYSFRAYPAEACDPPENPPLPKLGGVLPDLDVQIQIMIEEKVLGSKPNFNCKYYVAYWGCGPACQMVAVIDGETGHVVEVFDTAFGVLFSPKSRVLVLNPPRNEPMDVEYRKSKGEPSFYELKDGIFTPL
ncbi:MAG: hypothetical protein GYB31_15820 [Bacteroidetes bacterium]|nr:hypothetical protein [Bacteroidota bacterium]